MSRFPNIAILVLRDTLVDFVECASKPKCRIQNNTDENIVKRTMKIQNRAGAVLWTACGIMSSWIDLGIETNTARI